jgi:CheY-like chemotaxis protein
MLRSSPKIPPKLLCVDDDRSVRQFYQKIFESHGYRVLLAASGKEALQLLRSHRVEAVVSDYEMPEMSGGELAAAIKRRLPRTPFVLVSGREHLIENPPTKVDAVLAKGAPLGRLIEVIEDIRRQSFRRPARMTSMRPLVPLGEALASVAIAAFFLPRLLK